MTVYAASATQAVQPATPPPPPPPPGLTPVQQGDVAAGRSHVAEGLVFGPTSDSAPRTVDWGRQPIGTDYRAAFDSAAARLGTTDPATVGAELDRQLYGAPPVTSSTAQPAEPSQPAQPAADSEGVGSFIEGAVLGDFGDNNSWSATGGQVAVGFIPVVGQIADARDTIASVGQVLRGEEGGWLNLGASVVGWVPGFGDAAKAAIRGGSRIADAGTEVAQGVVRQTDEVAGRLTTTANRLGIPEADVRRIVETPRGDRPDPTTYMSREAIDQHLDAFRETGAVRFTPASNVTDYGTLGPPGGTFVIPRRELDALIEETGGDMAQIEQRLGLGAGSLTSGQTIAAYIAPEDLRGLRMPSGNERGANEFWLPGGYTSGGMPEATIDVPADTPYSVISFGD